MRHPTQRRARQAGFIQGAILFALALIGILVAAFATSNQGVSTQTDSEEARINASLLIKAGSDVQDAINRAVADRIDLQQVVIAPTADDDIELFSPELRFGSLPVLPATAATDGNVATLVWSMTPAPVPNVGEAGDNELIAELAGVSQVVCRRIESAVQGVAFNPNTGLPEEIPTADPGRREGCYSVALTGTATYYRVVSVDVAF